MILILDNYDSFTYNLYQVFLKLGYEIKVVRSDKITLPEIEDLNPTHIILSPGPGNPHEAGICIDVVKKLKGKYPILGVCLGHQAICAAFGSPIVSAARIVHGKVEKITHSEKGLFRNIPQGTAVTRYHSLAAKKKDIPECFEVTAVCEDGEVMAVEHKEYDLAGVQFHPESIGTKDGEQMIKNFLNYKRYNAAVKKHLENLVTQKSLSFEDAYDIMDEITEGNINEAQIGSILTSMQIKGVSSSELAGFASVLRKKAAFFPIAKDGENRIDTCGTGGSKEAKTFNVSSVVSILIAASGANVVKHGNRSATSKTGSADLFEALGVNIEMSAEKAYDIYEKLHLTFLFARKFHPAMRFVANVRNSLGFRTIFNLIGPLSNPAGATTQIIGVFDEKLTELICESLSMLGAKRAMVVHGLDGLDEISLSAPTKISELNDGWIKTYTFDPASIGLSTANNDKLKVNNPEESKNACLDILKGKKSDRAKLAFLNAGAALYIYGIAKDIREGYQIAEESGKTGKAYSLLEKFIELSKS